MNRTTSHCGYRPHGQRCEHGGDDCRADQAPHDVHADVAVGAEFADRRHQVADRVHFDEPWSQPGIVSTGTKAFDMNVSGNMMSIDTPCTVEALLIRQPISAKIHDTAKLQTNTSNVDPMTPTGSGRHPIAMPTAKVISVASK